MGLDMYLSAKRYMWYNEDDLKEQVAKAFPDLPEGIKPKEIVLEAAYWRKANQIHKWFVDNVQNGKDDCGDYWVGREHLEKLLGICKAIRETPSLGEELLPTQSGLFFGGTGYDEWYMEDINSTIEQLERALKLDKQWDFEYHASW